MGIDRFSKLEVNSEDGKADRGVVTASRKKKKGPVGQIDFDSVLERTAYQREAETKQLMSIFKVAMVVLAVVASSLTLAAHHIFGMDQIVSGVFKFVVFIVCPILIMRWLLKKNV